MKEYKTLKDLKEAIDTKKVDPASLTLYLDAGEVMVMNKEGDEVYTGYERQVITELFELFWGMKHMKI